MNGRYRCRARILGPEGFPLTIPRSITVESGGSSVGKLKGNKQPMFRGESTGFVNLLLCQHVPKPTNPHYS